MHIALVINDIKLYGQLRRHAYLLTPPDWPHEAKLHVLLKDPKTPEETILYRYALVTLGMVEPSIALLTYPDHLELGWNDEPR